MQLYLVGIDHNSAPSEIREKFRFYQKGGEKPGGPLPAETVLLITCNRIEIYLWSTRPLDRDLVAVFLEIFPSDDKIASEFFYRYLDVGAVQHLLELAVGLKSMIVGETEILGQISRAYQSVVGLNYLNRLFARVIGHARRIRTQTKIGENGLSLVNLVRKELAGIRGNLRDLRGLIIGNGDIARKVATVLAGEGVRLTIVNRDKILLGPGSGSLLSETGGLEKLIAENELIVTATGSPDFIIDRTYRGRLKKKILVDLSFPRNIHPEAATDGASILGERAFCK